MTAETPDFLALVKAIGPQQELLPADDMSAIAAVRRRSTGEKVTNERALLIAACKLSGMSDRATCEKVGCDSRTIPMIMRELERRGDVPALKEVVEREWLEVSRSAIIACREMIDSGKVSAELAAMIRSCGVLAGIGSDKASAAAPNVTINAGPGATVNIVAEAARRLQALDIVASDESRIGRESADRVVDCVAEPVPARPAPDQGGGGDAVRLEAVGSDA